MQLRLVRLYGRETGEALVVVPADGCGLANALQLSGGRLTDAQWRSAEECRIEALDGGWALSNHSRSLVCTLDGVRMPAGATAPIAAGSRLELGLLRFDVENAAAPVAQAVRHEPHAVRLLDSPPPDAPSDTFDLRDLARAASDADAGTAGDASQLDSPFGVLDISGAQALTLDESLEGVWQAPTRRVEAPSSVQPQARPQEPRDATSALLDGLHDEFVRTVRDPGHLAGRGDWEQAQPLHGDAAPSLEDLKHQAAPYPLLRDILLPREDIDKVIDDFDSLQRASLLDESSTDDVLGLFAPELARNAKAAVPSLTRREHHELSPDSFMPTGNGASKKPTQ